MSTVEGDLSLTIDDDDETPFQLAPYNFDRCAETPIPVASAVLIGEDSSDFTPITYLGAWFGKGTPLLAFVCSQLTHPSFRSDGLCHWAWPFPLVEAMTGPAMVLGVGPWVHGSPSSEGTDIPSPSNRTRRILRERKLRQGLERHDRRESGAVGSVREIANWLQMSQSDVLPLVGIKSRTFYHWQANLDVQPRLRNVEQLSKVHALLRGLIEDFGLRWTRDWIRRGNPSRLATMVDHPEDIDRIEDEGIDLMKAKLGQSLAELGRSWSPIADRDDAAEIARAEFVNLDPTGTRIATAENGEDDRG
jgi:hypothetical protein